MRIRLLHSLHITPLERHEQSWLLIPIRYKCMVLYGSTVQKVHPGSPGRHRTRTQPASTPAHADEPSPRPLMPTSSPVTRPLPRICTGADGATPCLPHSLRQKVRAVESTGSGTHWHPGHEARPPPVTEKLSQAWGRCSRISNLRADLSGALSASAARTPLLILGAWCRGA